MSQSVDQEPTGPFVGAAFICEQVLKDEQGVISAIRIVDKIIQTAEGADPPVDMPPANVTLKGFVLLKSGEARGRFVVTMRIENPAGIREDLGDLSMQFQGGGHGNNLILDLQLGITMPGLHWIDVLLDGKLMTRIPLEVVYQTRRIGASVSSP